MDLLGGYSSDSSQESPKRNTEDATRKQAASNTSTAINAATSTTQTQSLGHSQSKATSSSSQSEVSHRAKKLLKLQAVLPPHVWQRLTKSSQQDSDNDDDEDEDNNAGVESHIRPGGGNNERNNGHRQSDPKIQATSKPMASGPKVSSSTPLASLLQALPKAKSTSGLLVSPGGIGILGSTSLSMDSLSHIREDTRQSAGDSEPIDTRMPTHKQVRSIPTMDQSDSDGETNVDQSKKTQITASTTPRPRAIPNAPPQPTGAFLPTGVRGTSSVRTAAPTVRTMASSGVESPYHAPPPPPPPPSQQQHQHQPQAKSKKAHRKQMEAMLRAGNIYNVQSDIHLEGGGNTEFAQQQVASQAAAAAAAAASYQAHGVRVVPTTHYNVSTGTVAATTAISGKQRGKNQLNALLANAASLEASRLQNPQQATNPQATYRNNAKRKYGW